MIIINIADHYWIVGGSTTQVYSSKTNTYVPPDDADYVAWTAGKWATSIDSESELAAVLQSRGSQLPAWIFNAPSFVQPTPGAYSKDQLKAYCYDTRWRKEQGGITLTTGMPIATDDRAQAKINGVMLAAQYPPDGPAFTTKWHAADGTFWSIDTPGIVAMSGALQLHIDECFATSSATVDEIDAGVVTSLDQIDQAFGFQSK
jgi:Domain of unknown function (DUF4376)